MTVSRRHMLVSATAIAAVAFSGRFACRNAAFTAGPPGMDHPGMRDLDALILHDGGAAASAFVRTVHAAEDFGRIFEYATAMLTVEGFTHAGDRLDQTRGGVLLSLLDDADTVVVEALLRTRQAYGLSRQRYGRQVLLSARLRR